MNDARRGLPSVSTLLETPRVRALADVAGRAVVVDAIRLAVAAARDGVAPVPSTSEEWADAVGAVVTGLTRPSLRRVINATGVVLHTNLGRAPLARAAVDAIVAVASGFSNLEYDVDAGERGSRYTHCAALLRELTGAEDALVVNNCAAGARARAEHARRRSRGDRLPR